MRSPPDRAPRSRDFSPGEDPWGSFAPGKGNGPYSVVSRRTTARRTPCSPAMAARVRDLRRPSIHAATTSGDGNGPFSTVRRLTSWWLTPSARAMSATVVPGPWASAACGPRPRHRLRVPVRGVASLEGRGRSPWSPVGRPPAAHQLGRRCTRSTPHRVASRATPGPGAGRARPHATRGLRATRAEAAGRDTESIDDVSPLWDREVHVVRRPRGVPAPHQRRARRVLPDPDHHRSSSGEPTRGGAPTTR